MHDPSGGSGVSHAQNTGALFRMDLPTPRAPFRSSQAAIVKGEVKCVHSDGRMACM